MDTMFFILLGCSLYLLYKNKAAGTPLSLDRSALPFLIAMFLPTLAVFANHVSLNIFDLHPYDSPARFLLAPLIYLALANTPINLALMLEIAFPTGAIASLLTAKVTPTVDGRAVTYFLDAIHFGDLALLFGFLSLFSINWGRRDPRWVLSLKLLGFIAGLYTSILSGTRGGWVAIPVLFTLWLFWSTPKQLKVYRTLMVLTACLASYFLSGMVHQRVDRAISNLHSYEAGQVDSGTAARLELWKASYYMFTQRPLFGVGPVGFKQMLTNLHDRGIINELVVTEGNAEAHSEIAGNLARYGAAGLISILALYFAPIWSFRKFLHSDSLLSAGAARMGICVAVSFLIFGLTVETFDLKMVAAIYSLTISVLFAIVTNKHEYVA